MQLFAGGSGMRVRHSKNQSWTWCGRTINWHRNPLAQLLVPNLSFPGPATRLPVDALLCLLCTRLIRFTSTPLMPFLRGLLPGHCRGHDLWTCEVHGEIRVPKGIAKAGVAAVGVIGNRF